MNRRVPVFGTGARLQRDDRSMAAPHGRVAAASGASRTSLRAEITAGASGSFGLEPAQGPGRPTLWIGYTHTGSKPVEIRTLPSSPAFSGRRTRRASK